LPGFQSPIYGDINNLMHSRKTKLPFLHPNTDKNKRIFPIPQTAVDGASNLKDYLKQNAGY
jgi:hypothetical protein